MEKEFLTVIMPVYNEKDTLTKAVRSVLDIDILKELIIVDDRSTDGTLEMIRDMELGEKVRKYYHGKNMGKGAAIRTAQEYIMGEVVAIQDADLEYDPQEFYELTAPIRKGVADVVYGSRLSGGKAQRVHMFWHLVGNRFLTLVTNMFFNATLTDMETCYKVVKSDIFKNIKIRSNDFSFEPELTAKLLKQKLRIYEMPISYYGRSYDEGKKITWKHGFGALWALLKYRFIN